MKYDISFKKENYLYIAKKQPGKPKFIIEEYNLDKYILVKGSSNFRIISKEDIYNYKYCSVLLFKKEYYKQEDFELWFNFLIQYKIDCKFLTKPFPPIEVINKIKIIEKK